MNQAITHLRKEVPVNLANDMSALFKLPAKLRPFLPIPVPG